MFNPEDAHVRSNRELGQIFAAAKVSALARFVICTCADPDSLKLSRIAPSRFQLAAFLNSQMLDITCNVSAE
jgi:hypothetical protein